MDKKKFTYKDSGVDIEAGDAMVDSIKSLVHQTHNDGVLSNIGSFGGFFKPDIDSFSEPVFVSSVDGVGTKLIVAFKTEIYHTIGQDLVNHCVNDIAVCGADPLFFMDYFSTGTLNQETAYQVVKGFTMACKQNGVALIGGETAEMPDIYQPKEFDVAGMITGIVDQKNIIDGRKIEKGDLLLGFASSGLHTNGYSLARKVLFSEYNLTDFIDELDKTLGQEMLSIHKTYLSLIKKLRAHKALHGFAHITGGGIIGNTRRILPQGRSLHIDWNGWERPAIFKLIQKIGNVPEADMRATFNLGIGLIAVVDPDQKKEIETLAGQVGEKVILMGRIE